VFFLIGFIAINLFCWQEGVAQDEENAPPCAVSARVHCQNFTELDSKILHFVLLPFLNDKDLFSCARVCRPWHQAISDDKLLKPRVSRLLQVDDPSKLIKQYPSSAVFLKGLNSYSFRLLNVADFYSLDNIVVSNDGSTVAGVIDRYTEGFGYDDEEGVSPIPFLEDRNGYTKLERREVDCYTKITGISPDGSVVEGQVSDITKSSSYENRMWIKGKIYGPSTQVKIPIKKTKPRKKKFTKEIIDSGVLDPRLTDTVGTNFDGSRVVGNITGYTRRDGVFLWEKGSGLYDLQDVLAAKGLLPEGCVLKEIHGISANGLFMVGECSLDDECHAWMVCIPPSFKSDPSCIGLRKTRSMVSRVLGFGSGIIVRIGRMFLPPWYFIK